MEKKHNRIACAIVWLLDHSYSIEEALKPLWVIELLCFSMATFIYAASHSDSANGNAMPFWISSNYWHCVLAMHILVVSCLIFFYTVVLLVRIYEYIRSKYDKLWWKIEDWARLNC